MYLETGAVPHSFIISSRRLNYLHTIVTIEDEELTKIVYLAQKSNPSHGDFVKLIENDFKTIGEEINQNFVRNMGKEQFKIFVINKIKEATLKYLQDKQTGHSKDNEIEYSRLEIQQYLTNPKFNKRECELLFALRPHTVRVIKANTPSIYRNNMFCPLNCKSPNQQDEQEHLLKCKRLISELNSEQSEIAQVVEYKYLFGNTHEQKAAVSIFMKLLEVRNRLLEENISATTPASGASLDTASQACQGSGGDTRS